MTGLPELSGSFSLWFWKNTETTCGSGIAIFEKGNRLLVAQPGHVRETSGALRFRVNLARMFRTLRTAQ